MMKKILTITALLLSIQLILACKTPIIRNEYGVPVNLYGEGYTIINGTEYPEEIKMLKYNLTVQNLNDEKFYLTFTPLSGLSNYVYAGTYEIEPSQTQKVTMSVYIDGSTKYGQMYVEGYCQDGFGIPEGWMNMRIYGRGNSDPQFCSNNVLSCGVYPDCQDLTQMNGCYDGYYRNYACVSNSPQFSQTCTETCCQQYAGSDGYCYLGECINPDDSCIDECFFIGESCLEGDVYSCIQQEDGCRDLIRTMDCDTGCFNGECVDGSGIRGKIAFLCAEEECDDDLEPEVISWLRLAGWYVEGKPIDQWTVSYIAGFDVVACSDQTVACKPSSNSAPYYAHKNLGKHFLEIADYRYAQAAFKLNYISNPYSTLTTSNNIYDTDGDIIMEIFPSSVQIFPTEKKMTVNPDYRLEPEVMDVADAGGDNGKSTLFKVESEGSQGRYTYVGWFYRGNPSELTTDGQQILDRTVLWTYCGDACLIDPNRNLPPVAVAEITPHPVAYVDQIVEFDGSESYDPEEEPLTYYWDFGDGTNSGWISSPVTTHVYTEPDTYDVTLKVNDGELESDPVTTELRVKPQIQNAVAVICADDSCNDNTEQDVIGFLRDNGFYVKGKSEGSWTYEDLGDYDFMLCADALSGCNIHSWSDIYEKHMEDGMGFFELSDYRYLRAADEFGYITWWVGYEKSDDEIRITSTEDDITEGFSGVVRISNSPSEMVGLYHRNLGSSINLADITNKDTSTMFRVDASGFRGRYAFLGWFYKRSTSDLTQTGETLLLRALRWVQCGNVNSCN